MEANFFIKYRNIDESNEPIIDLALFGESIIGFNKIITELFKISKIKADIEVSALKVREGSIVVDILISLANNIDQIPFDHIIDLLNFLKVVDQEIHNQANDFFNGLSQIHKNVNDYAKEYPLNVNIIAGLLPLFIDYLIKKASNSKNKLAFDAFPKEYTTDFRKLVENNSFKSALKPLIENEVSEIITSHNKDFQKETTINFDNLDNYLREDEKILPEWEDESIQEIVGQVVGMQCNRGDSMKIKIDNKITLIAFPPDDKTTQDFDDLYSKEVKAEVLVQRKSLFQKPKIKIIDIQLYQSSIFESK